MKKFLQNTLARALCVLVLGILLIAYSGKITEWLVQICGLLFIVPGLVSLVGYFRRDPDGRGLMLYPVLFAGSICFGFVLIVWPQLFITTLLYILSGLLIIAAATQFYTLWDIHRGGIRFNGAFYLIPALELAAGLYVILTNDGNREKIASLPVVFTGIGFIIYALIEIWTVILVKHANVHTNKKNEIVVKGE